MPKTDIELSQLPISHRVAAWHIALHTEHSYRQVLRWTAGSRVRHVCGCRDADCATFTLERDPRIQPDQKGGVIANSDSGMVITHFEAGYIEIEALRYEDFPHRKEIRRAIKGLPYRPRPARKARKALRSWLADKRERPIHMLEVDA